MAFARLVFYPGGTAAQFEAVAEAIGPAMADADGRTFMAAGPAEGGFSMFMVWETEDDFWRFAAEHIGPGHERAGDRGWQSNPTVTDFEVTHTFT